MLDIDGIKKTFFYITGFALFYIIGYHLLKFEYINTGENPRRCQQLLPYYHKLIAGVVIEEIDTYKNSRDHIRVKIIDDKDSTYVFSWIDIHERRKDYKIELGDSAYKMPGECYLTIRRFGRLVTSFSAVCAPTDSLRR